MRVLSVLNLIHSSRRDSLLLSASRSAANAEPFAKVPSLRSTAVPLNARVVSTASPGAGIAATCSRTRIVASDRSATISKRRAPAGNAAALAAGVADDADGVVGAGGDACGAVHETRAASAATASAARNGMRTSGRPKMRTPPRRTVLRRAGDRSELPLRATYAGDEYRRLTPSVRLALASIRR